VCGSAPLDFTYSQRNPRYCDRGGRSILTDREGRSRASGGQHHEVDRLGPL